ncbi:MAG: restriction endonuclease subunit S [Pseudomonadota bacterium]|nr:restriction endonuclease subunit S [Pseudomonadota bacterium]
MSWTPQRLDELGYLSRGRSRHRPRDAAHLYDGPYPFIQTGDVKHAGLYITDYQQTYSEAGLEQSGLWPTGTLCITIAANIADTAILGIDACFPDSVIGFMPDEEKADARFVKYLFDATIQQRVQQFTQGAAQDNLSQEKLLSIEFSVPSLNEQKRIGDILSAYDDLIENNRRRMALLEEAARQLYREWFVRLRFPGHEHTHIIDGVPERWERVRLGDRVTLNYGKALKADDRVEGEYPVFGSSGIVGMHDKPLVQGPGIAVGRKGNVGSVYWSSKGFYPIDTVYFVGPECSDLYLYYALKHMHFISTDGAVPGLNRDFAYSRPLLIPPKSILREFLETATPFYAQMEKLDEVNEKLRAARDLLLPRLMNGQIVVWPAGAARRA